LKEKEGGNAKAAIKNIQNLIAVRPEQKGTGRKGGRLGSEKTHDQQFAQRGKGNRRREAGMSLEI